MDDIKIIPDKNSEKKSASSGLGISLEGVSQLSERLIEKSRLWFVLSIVFLIVSVLLSLGLWGYKTSLAQEEENLVKRIGDLESQRDREFESNLMDLKEKIEGVESILENRVYSSVVFALLEELVVPGAQFAGFNTNLNKGEVILEIKADNFVALNKQIVVFEQDERIEKVSLSSSNLDEVGKVSSEVGIKIRTNILYSK